MSEVEIVLLRFADLSEQCAPIVGGCGVRESASIRLPQTASNTLEPISAEINRIDVIGIFPNARPWFASFEACFKDLSLTRILCAVFILLTTTIALPATHSEPLYFTTVPLRMVVTATLRPGEIEIVEHYVWFQASNSRFVIRDRAFMLKLNHGSVGPLIRLSGGRSQCGVWKADVNDNYVSLATSGSSRRRFYRTSTQIVHSAITGMLGEVIRQDNAWVEAGGRPSASVISSLNDEPNWLFNC